MPKTNLEKRLAHVEKPGLIVPLLTELLKSPLGIETEEDARWLYDLAMKQVRRDEIRNANYDNDEMVFSPSGLGDCLRRVYLGKNHKKYGLKRVSLPKVEPHFYFFTGDFLHLKWQFAFYKLHQLHPEFHLVDVELPIMSKRRDHGGTLDVLCLFMGEALIIDVKGLNVRSFMGIDKGEPNHTYRIQTTDYGMLFNSALQRGAWKPDKATRKYLKSIGLEKFPKVKRVVLLAENKGGPDANHPAALTEALIDLKSNLPEVRARLEVLREHEEKEEVPSPECISTRGIQFTGCPFAPFCLSEVQKIEKARARDTASNPNLKISRPTRRRRTG